MERFHQTRFSLYVIDLDMAASDGLSMFAITLTGQDDDHPPVIVGCTRNIEETSGAWADRSMFAALLPAPFRPEQLLAVANEALSTAA